MRRIDKMNLLPLVVVSESPVLPAATVKPEKGKAQHTSVYLPKKVEQTGVVGIPMHMKSTEWVAKGGFTRGTWLVNVPKVRGFPGWSLAGKI